MSEPQEKLKKAIDWLLRGSVAGSGRRVGLRVLHRENQWDLVVFKGTPVIAIHNMMAMEWDEKPDVDNSFLTNIPDDLSIPDVADAMCRIFDKAGLGYRMKTLPGEVLRIRIEDGGMLSQKTGNSSTDILGIEFLNDPENTAEKFL